MFKRINKIDDLVQELKKQGKVRELDSPEYYENVRKFDKEFEQVIRRQKIMEAQSNESASKAFITC